MMLMIPKNTTSEFLFLLITISNEFNFYLNLHNQVYFTMIINSGFTFLTKIQGIPIAVSLTAINCIPTYFFNSVLLKF